MARPSVGTPFSLRMGHSAQIIHFCGILTHGDYLAQVERRTCRPRIILHKSRRAAQRSGQRAGRAKVHPTKHRASRHAAEREAEHGAGATLEVVTGPSSYITITITIPRGTHEADELPAEVDWWDRTRAECITITIISILPYITKVRVVLPFDHMVRGERARDRRRGR